jgi:hypothetical protein
MATRWLSVGTAVDLQSRPCLGARSSTSAPMAASILMGILFIYFYCLSLRSVENVEYTNAVGHLVSIDVGSSLTFSFGVLAITSCFYCQRLKRLIVRDFQLVLTVVDLLTVYIVPFSKHCIALCNVRVRNRIYLRPSLTSGQYPQSILGF